MEDLSSVELKERELTESLLERYTAMCGDLGLKTFRGVTLPRLFARYRTDYDALQEVAKEIIEAAVYYDRREIEGFLEGCV